MLHKLKGIVLHSIKYHDDSLIVYLYTNKFGRQTYIAKGVRKPKAKIKANIFQPLFLLDFEASHRERAGINVLRECKIDTPLLSMSTDVYKSTIALFMGELLYKLIREEEHNAGLFEFLYHSICLLNQLDEGIANFHLHFMVQLSKYLGFLPLNNSENNPYFDIKSSTYTAVKPLHPQYFEQSSTNLLSLLQQTPATKINSLQLSREIRYTFLDNMVAFYTFHFDRILPIHSLTVLREVFTH